MASKYTKEEMEKDRQIAMDLVMGLTSAPKAVGAGSGAVARGALRAFTRGKNPPIAVHEAIANIARRAGINKKITSTRKLAEEIAGLAQKQRKIYQNIDIPKIKLK